MDRANDIRRAGFTLVELLIAMTLFLGIAFVLYSFVRGGVDMWRTGERRQDLYERAQLAFSRIDADLRCTFRPQRFEEATPAAMFLSDRPDMPKKDRRGNRVDERKRPLGVIGSRLRFVRTIRGEFQNPATRFSGLAPGAKDVYRFKPDVDQDGEPLERDYRAPAGLMEVAYLATALPEQDDGTTTLLRAAQTPVGERNTFFDDDVIQDAEFLSWATPVVDGILFFGLEFWDQHTDRWADDRAEAFTDGVWDSTRGRLQDFKFYRKGSLTSDLDDVYPRRVRVRLVVGRPGDPSMSAKLRDGLVLGEKGLRVDRPGGLAIQNSAFVLVGGTELMRIERVGGTRAKIVQRGVFGTREGSHEAGAPVVWGELFTRVVNIPCYREDWNE